MKTLILISCLYMLVNGIATENASGSLHTEKKACYGTHNGISFSGTPEFWYNHLRTAYTGCTHLFGNLEITNIGRHALPSIDLSFLATIEVVTGYVLFVNVQVDVIPLTRLRHIRGDEKFDFHGTKYALAVLLTESGGGFQLPAIKEITGNVIFKLWSGCYTDTIDWDLFTQGTVSHEIMERTDCEDCDPACLDTDHGVRRCWGTGQDLCQRVNRVECGWSCRDGTCFEEGILGCCHPECLGCHDGWIDTACEFCRHFRYGEHCVRECPPDSYDYIDTCYPRSTLQLFDDNTSS